MSRRIGVLGAGAWGTALAALLARKGDDVVLWALEPAVASQINRRHENSMYLPGVNLPRSLRATASAVEVVRNAESVVVVTPAQHLREVLASVAPALPADVVLVSASKGIEAVTLLTMAEVMAQVAPERIARRATFLSGPSFAMEVAREQATAVTVAGHETGMTLRAQALFQTPFFRVYTTDDVVGVELGGALKNVIALAAGMAAGLNLGHNATAALITRGLAEIARLAHARGANPLTLSGLAGMGDLIVTCTGDLSRNRAVGVELGRGRPIADILAGRKTVAEGIETTRAAHALARRENIEMPIVSEVHAVLFEGRAARDALENLMLREPKPELWR